MSREITTTDNFWRTPSRRDVMLERDMAREEKKIDDAGPGWNAESPCPGCAYNGTRVPHGSGKRCTVCQTTS